jgi:hypothetical protein
MSDPCAAMGRSPGGRNISDKFEKEHRENH